MPNTATENTGATPPDRPADPLASSPQGNTLPTQGETGSQDDVPRLPHERDESADSQPDMNPENKRLGKIAQADVERGLQDTSKALATDAAYTKLRESTPDPGKKMTP